MTTDDYKEKYEAALERCKKLYNEAKANEYTSDIEDYESIFPELKESEDERIRKELLNAFQESEDSLYMVLTPFRRESFIAWLEKQGERPKKVSIWKHWSGNGIAGNGEGKNIYLIKRGMIYEVSSCLAFECDYIELSELVQLMQEEKQGEQSNANKEYWRGYREGKQEVLDKYSELKKQGEQKPAHIDYVSEIREELLSIEDNAKNINGLTESQWVAIRAAHRLLGEYITKEQKPTAWSEEDEAALGDALWCCKQAASIAKDENDMGNVWYAETWLKSLKDRVFPQTKQEWSEEDEEMYKVRSEKYEKYGQC